MSITSPEHIRHLAFLLIISVAHRRVPIPPRWEQWSRRTQTTKTSSEMNSAAQCKYKKPRTTTSPCTLNCARRVVMCVIQRLGPFLALGLHIRPAVINYRWPCLHRERRWLRTQVERLPADDLGACTRSHACMHALHTYAGRLSPAVDLCMHIKIDERDTGRRVFFYFTQNLRACFLLSFFSLLIGLEGIFFPSPCSCFLYFPLCHAPTPASHKGGRGGKREKVEVSFF